jgi:hypothetical protein
MLKYSVYSAIAGLVKIYSPSLVVLRLLGNTTHFLKAKFPINPTADAINFAPLQWALKNGVRPIKRWVTP